MGLLSRDEIINLIEEITNCGDKSEEEIDGLIDKLEQGVLDPHISDYIFWDEMTPEEVTDTDPECRIMENGAAKKPCKLKNKIFLYKKDCRQQQSFLYFYETYQSVNRHQALKKITRADAKGQLPCLIHPAVNLTYRPGRMQEVQHSGRNKERASHRDFRHTVLHSRIDTEDHWLRPDRLHISYLCYQRYL